MSGQRDPLVDGACQIMLTRAQGMFTELGVLYAKYRPEKCQFLRPVGYTMRDS